MPQKRHGPVDVMSVDRAMLAGTPPRSSAQGYNALKLVTA
jgi:hypothetical protein